MKFEFRKQNVKISTKGIVIVALTMGCAVPGMAQTSKFEGWSATAGLGYQSLKPKFDHVVSDGDAKTVTATTANGLAGKVGLEYTWALNAKFAMTAGLDYGLNYGKSSELSMTGAGGSDTGRIRFKQGAGVSLSPGWLIEPDTLAYLKMGYMGTTAKIESDSSKESGNAFVYGLGAKFLQTKDVFVYTELNYLVGKKKDLTSDPTTTGDLKTNGYSLSAGIGKRF